LLRHRKVVFRWKITECHSPQGVLVSCREYSITLRFQVDYEKMLLHQEKVDTDLPELLVRSAKVVST
jgi:hypothetical protein